METSVSRGPLYRALVQCRRPHSHVTVLHWHAELNCVSHSDTVQVWAIQMPSGSSTLLVSFPRLQARLVTYRELAVLGSLCNLSGASSARVVLIDLLRLSMLLRPHPETCIPICTTSQPIRLESTAPLLWQTAISHMPIEEIQWVLSVVFGHIKGPSPLLSDIRKNDHHYLDTSKDLFQYSDTSDKGTSPLLGHMKEPFPVLRHIRQRNFSSTWTHQRTFSSTQTHHKKGPSSLFGHIIQRTFTSAWTHQTKALLQHLDIGPSPLPNATESEKSISLKINIQMGQPEKVLADECTVPYTVLWPDILHYHHLSNCGNASDSNNSNHERLWQVKTYFQYAE